MRKTLIIALVLLCMMCICPKPTVNAESDASTDFFYKGLEEFGTTKNQQSIVINEKDNVLFVEFEDPEMALKIFSKECKAFVREYSNSTIECLSKDNIDDFYEEYIKRRCNDLKDDKVCFKEETLAFELLLDVYENTEKNARILEITGKNHLSESEKEELAYLLPNFDPYVESYFSEHKKDSMTRSFNLSNAVSYATTYALGHNSNYYYYWLGDCANFASQILEAGGYSQNYTGNQSTGWWHLNDGTNTSSNSWRLADSFCDYFGVGVKTTSHYLFSLNLSAGNFICFDKYKDGDWDHVGFVTQKDASYSSTLGYYDYTVAQHTPSYIAKTSSTTNNWETLESSTTSYWYGIIVVN